jgi:imidazolonepropionase-like amidohydrolase
VLVASTKTAAECLGWQDRVGTIEAGKLADIVISTVDPLTNIHPLANNDTLALVMKDGQVVKDLIRKEIEQMVA